jgi:hypothetical protein
MTADCKSSTPPAVRTRRVLASQPVLNDVAPSYRSQEGEFVFLSPESMAANDDFLRELEAARTARFNLSMLAVVLCLLIAVSVIAFGVFVFIAQNFNRFARFVLDLPAPVQYGIAGGLACVLAIALFIHIRDRREAELA